MRRAVGSSASAGALAPAGPDDVPSALADDPEASHGRDKEKKGHRHPPARRGLRTAGLLAGAVALFVVVGLGYGGRAPGATLHWPEPQQLLHPAQQQHLAAAQQQLQKPESSEHEWLSQQALRSEVQAAHVMEHQGQLPSLGAATVEFTAPDLRLPLR